MWNSQLQPLAALAVPMLKRCKLSSSSDGSSSYDDDSYGGSFDDDSYGGSSVTSSSSEDEGDCNLGLARKELCLGCNRFTYCTLPHKPSVPFFLVRHLKVAPAPRVLPKQKRHLEGWGADMIRKAGTKHSKLVPLKTYFWINSELNASLLKVFPRSSRIWQCHFRFWAIAIWWHYELPNP